MRLIEQTSVVKQREEIIASACGKMAEKLRQIPPFAYACFFNFGNMPNVFDQINTTIENCFETGTMSFPCTGDCYLSWDQYPIVALDLEFANEDVSVFFRLLFAENDLIVNLHHISFYNSTGDPNANTAMLEQHIMQASN